MKRFLCEKTDDEVRKAILDAAEKRFKQYGFKKTAMSELAEDVGMSTSNLYRYFSSKLDIAEAFALRCFAEKEIGLQLLLEKPLDSAVDSLVVYAKGLLQYNFDQLYVYPAINDMIMALCEASSEMVDKKREGELSILKVILKKGQEEKCWEIDDLDETGLAIMASWVMFSTPTFMRHQTLEQLEKRLSNLLNLIITGLKVRE
ncbi:MAG: TetR/AcrR family transcriptional regulator [Cycloclasticus sp.]|nr:TetR/AcrR family transcriptional regulator [Cycloclasticus sp.]